MEGLEIFIRVVVCWRLEFNPYMRYNFGETENLKLFVACRNAFGWRLFTSSTCGRLEERSTLLKGFLHKWDKHTAQGANTHTAQGTHVTHTHYTRGNTEDKHTQRGQQARWRVWRFFTGDWREQNRQIPTLNLTLKLHSAGHQPTSKCEAGPLPRRGHDLKMWPWGFQIFGLWYLYIIGLHKRLRCYGTPRLWSHIKTGK